MDVSDVFPVSLALHHEKVLKRENQSVILIVLVIKDHFASEIAPPMEEVNTTHFVISL